MAADQQAIQDFHVVTTIDELRAIADEARVEVLSMLSREAMTGTMVARELNVPASRAHYHLQRLLKSGLIRNVSSSRRGEWKGERYFVATARNYLVDPRLGCRDSDTTTVLSQSIAGAFLDWRRTRVLEIDWAPLAQKVARDSLRIRRGDRVLLTFHPSAIEFAETLLIRLEATGAIVHPRPWSKNVVTRTLDHHGEDELRRRPFIPEWIDGELDVVLLLTRSLLEGPPPTEEQQAKLPAFFEAVSRWQRSVRERQLRYLEIALPQRAEFDRGTMSTEESIDVFWRCIDADPHVLHERGEGLRALVVANPELRIWSPAGTNLRVTISPEQTQVHDGIVSEEDIRRGRCAEYLPSGLLSMLPVPGSGEGVIRAPYTFSQGRDFRDITLTVHEGRIVDLDLGSGNESLAEQIQRAAGEPRLISGIDVGINVAGTGSTGKPTLDSRMEGVVTVSFGNNELDGGTVSSTLTLNFPLIKHSLSAGNENLCLDGRLASQG